MAVFLLRTAFRTHSGGDNFLLAGRIYPASTILKPGDWLVFGQIKVLVQEVEKATYEGVILTISQDAVETLRRTGIALTRLYGAEIPLESATQQARFE